MESSHDIAAPDMRALAFEYRKSGCTRLGLEPPISAVTQLLLGRRLWPPSCRA